jgi:hypothetical protein
MFRLIEPSPGQIQNILLVHSVSAYSLTECTNVPITCFVFGLMMAQGAETCCRIFNISNINYYICLVIDGKNDYISICVN